MCVTVDPVEGSDVLASVVQSFRRTTPHRMTSTRTTRSTLSKPSYGSVSKSYIANEIKSRSKSVEDITAVHTTRRSNRRSRRGTAPPTKHRTTRRNLTPHLTTRTATIKPTRETTKLVSSFSDTSRKLRRRFSERKRRTTCTCRRNRRERRVTPSRVKTSTKRRRQD